MNFEFQKEVERWIIQDIKPLAKDFGLRPGRKLCFVQECNGVVQWIHFVFSRINLNYSAGISPLYDHFCGTSAYDGFPTSVYQTQKAMSIAQCLPTAYEDWNTHLKMCAGDEFAIENSRQKARENFEKLVDFLRTDLFPVYLQINSLSEWHTQMRSNILLYDAKSLNNNTAGDYILGVYDCLVGRYADGLEKLINVQKSSLPYFEKMVRTVKGYDINHLKHNDSEGRKYKFSQMFVTALKSHPNSIEERFLETYGQVCQEMRIWHKLSK